LSDAPRPVGVVTHPDPDLSAHYFAESLAGVREGLGAGFDLRVNPAPGWAAGLIYLGPSSSDDLKGAGVPVVAVNGIVPGIPSVDSDNERTVFEALSRWISVGRRRIAIVNGKLHTDNGRDRFAGYRRALAHAGIAEDPALIAPGDFTFEAGAAAVRRWNDAGVLPQAVFAANDQSALGVLDALAALGRRVPEETGVMGFDDMPAAAAARPPLTTVRQPFREMGRRGAALLRNWLVSGREPSADMRVMVPSPLIVRSSCGINKK
jgi:LacI family transcriptional regulator